MKNLNSEMSKIQNFGVNPKIKQLVNIETFKVLNIFKYMFIYIYAFSFIS